MKTNAPRLFFVDKESGVSFDVFHVLSVSFPVTAVPHMTGNVTFAILLKMCHLQEPAVNPVCRICITVPDERKTYVAVKKPALLPALVIAVK